VEKDKVLVLLNLEGRRKELILAALLYLVGALVTALAPTYSVLIIGRVIYGVSVGLVRLIMLLYCLTSKDFLMHANGSNVIYYAFGGVLRIAHLLGGEQINAL